MGTNAKFRDLAIRTLIGEAAQTHGVYDRDSMISVAHVIKNRADSGAWGDAAQGGGGRVILAPKQFSMWNADISSSGKTISPSDPNYQRAGEIVDGVFDGRIPDNTGGATNYYAPSGMKGRPAPEWSIGQTPTTTIGGQHFYRLPLTAATTGGTATISPSTVGQGQSGTPAAAPLAALPDAAKPAAANAITSALASAKSMLGKNEVPNHDEIMSYLHDGGQDLDPHKLAWCASFVSASLQKAGLPVPTEVAKGSLQSGGANARNYLGYGTAVTDPNGIQAGDILVAKNGSHVGFAEGPMRQGINGPEVQLLAGNEGDNTGRFKPGSYTNPETGAVANRQQVGMVGERWVPLSDYVVRRATPADGQTAAPAPGKGGIGSDANIPLGTAPAGTAPAVSTVVPNPNAPAANAQPVSATAPTSAAAPGSDKYSVLQGMTAGTGRNPMLYTAANFGNLFGGAAPSVPAPPAAAPAATTATSPQPASAPAAAPTGSQPGMKEVTPPINRNTPLPWQGPPQGPPQPTPWQRNTTDQNNPMPWTAAGPGHVPNWGPWHAGGTPSGPIVASPPPLPAVNSPLGSIMPNQGAANPNDPEDLGHGRFSSGAPAATPNAPSMGFPAMTNPFGQSPPNQPVSQLPGSMFASAQNLIKYLFPSSVG